MNKQKKDLWFLIVSSGLLGCVLYDVLHELLTHGIGIWMLLATAVVAIVWLPFRCSMIDVESHMRLTLDKRKEVAEQE